MTRSMERQDAINFAKNAKLTFAQCEKLCDMYTMRNPYMNGFDFMKAIFGREVFDSVVFHGASKDIKAGE